MIYSGTGNKTISYPRDDITYENTEIVFTSASRPANSSYTETNLSPVGLGFTLNESDKTITIHASAFFQGLQYTTVAVCYNLSYELRYYGK